MPTSTHSGIRTAAAIAVSMFALACSANAFAADNKLSGAEEVPPVTTSATGESMIKISDTGAVSGSVKTMGIDGTAAHIHDGAAGSNGPVIVPLQKGTAGMWMVPDGAKLTDAQMKDYKAGHLYVNVHSAAHKDGEIRDQLEP